jgi:serralysin
LTDIPGNTSTTATITVGGSTSNSLEVLGDHDWYKITLTAGQSIVIDASSPGFTVDTYLNLYDPSGTTILASNDDGGAGTNSKLVFTASTAGTYYIDVGAWHDQSSGSYTLSVSTYVPPPVATNDQIADQLINGYWDANYGPGNAHHFNVTQGGQITVNISTLTPAEQNLARAALAQWSDIIGVTFTEVTSGGQIQFNNAEDPVDGSVAQTDANWGANHITTSATIQISSSWVNNYGTGLDTYSFQTYLHEIGHALGLGHAGDYNGSADYAVDALFANDSWASSVMSYFSQTENSYTSGQGFTYAGLVTPMVADILAMQQIYGLSTTTRTGNTTYGFNSNAGRDVFNATLYPNVAYTIFDSGGVDTLDYSGFANGQLINLNSETFMNVGSEVGNVVIARGTVIENAIGGSGSDSLIGNGAANTLTGNGGNDTLDGGIGADAMSGGAGDDTYYVDNNGDTVTENAGEGTDTVISSASFTLGANVENLTLTGALSRSATGNSLANVIIGNSGSNLIYGGGGADTMSGGLGNDTYVVDNVGDVVTENSGEGTDTVKATINYTLGANVEYLTLSGATNLNGTGNALDNVIRGNSGDNVLDGGFGNDSIIANAGNDTLIGGDGNDKLNGGTGNDSMTGGLGNDIFYVDSLSDTVTENANEGTADKVVASIDYTIGANIERLALDGTGSINGTGNTLANVLYGNDGANILSGLAGADSLVGYGGNDTLVGGTGRDTMTGGLGNDTFLFADGDFGGATTSTGDRITDFTSGQDKIDLAAVDSNTLLGGDQSFSFIGTGAFTHTAGELRYEQVSGNTYVSGDTNGDGIADFMIKVDGLHAFVQTDFVI